jgi:hypothetical protein
MAAEQADLRRRGKGEHEVASNEAGTEHDSEKDEVLVEARISDAGGWDLFAGESHTFPPGFGKSCKQMMATTHFRRDAR